MGLSVVKFYLGTLFDKMPVICMLYELVFLMFQELHFRSI